MRTRFALTLLLAAGLGAGHPAVAGEITVSAAASLTQAFTEVAHDYEATHPGQTVRLNFGASGALLQQIAAGAPVDVFAAADQDTMDRAQQKTLIVDGERRNFAGNTLVVAVPADSALRLTSVAALAAPDVQRVALGQPDSVPAGHYAQRALQAAGQWPAVSAKAIYAGSVRQCLDYVARGEVDAAFVYATDLKVLPGKVKLGLRVPLDVAIRYPIAPVADSAHAAEARAFIAYVLSAPGQATLRRLGFLAP